MKQPRSRTVAVALWSAVAVIAALVVLFAALGKPQRKLEAPPEKAVPVRVLEIAARSLPDSLLLPGRVEAALDVTLSTEAAGRVTELLADRGARVSAGQPLLRLDVSTWRAQMKRMEIEVRENDKELARCTEMEKAGGASASDLDRARKARDLAAAGLEEARVHVDKGEVRSPVAGTVDDRFLEAGEYAKEGVAAFRVVDTDTVKVVVEVPERDVARIRPAAPVPFRAASLPGPVFTGRVAHVSLAGSRQSNSFRTELRAANPGRALRPGMIVEAEFDRGERSGVVVAPMTAVIPKRGEYYVFIARGDRAALRYVRLEAILGQEAVIASGLAPGDLLVVEGHRGLQDGTLLRIAGNGD